MEFYIDALIEALLNTLSPIFTERTAEAMQAFGGYDMPFAAAMSALGGVAAGLLLVILGRVLFRAGQHPRIAFDPKRYTRLYEDAHQYGIWLLLLVWLPIGFIIAVAAGFFRIPFRVAMPLILVGMGVHYALALVV